MDEILKKPLSEIDDKTLFELLDNVSGEVKRRNGLIGPPVSNIRDQPLEKTVASFLEALANLGVKPKSK